MSSAKIQYLHMLVRGESLRKFNTLSAEVGSTISENLESIFGVWGTYFFPVNDLFKESA